MSWLRRSRYALEAAAATFAFTVFGLLPRRSASALGGWLARAVGPRLAVSDVARRNLGVALPELDPTAIERVVGGVWENLGRTIAEYPHLAAIDCFLPGGPVEVVGIERLARLKAQGRAVVFVSAHYGNWEIASLAAGQFGMPFHYVYRQANNPYIERWVQRFRRATLGAYHPKGAAGLRELIRAARRGEHLGLLADQKTNEGIAVPFFGRPAMTGAAVARIALRYGLDVVPARVDRLSGGRFRVTVETPIDVLAGADAEADVAALLGRINRIFEDWIRARPDHWLWLHRRWPERR